MAAADDGLDLTAEQREAMTATPAVKWRGMKFTLRPTKVWLFPFQRAQKRDDLVGMIEAVLGPDQTDALEASGHTDAVDDLPDLMAAIGDALGGSGKHSASPSS